MNAQYKSGNVISTNNRTVIHSSTKDDAEGLNNYTKRFIKREMATHVTIFEDSMVKLRTIIPGKKDADVR